MKKLKIPRRNFVVCGIVTEDYKHDIFHRHLSENSYEFQKVTGPTPGMITFRVETTNPFALQAVIQKAVDECAGLSGLPI